jgi:hypothetical protein
VSHLYSFTLYWKNNVKEFVEIQNAHYMVYSITWMNHFHFMNIFLKLFSLYINLLIISIYNIINEYKEAFDYTSYNNVLANNDWSL